MIKIRMILFAVFTVILLGACGGGGNSGDALTGSANEDEPDRGTTTPSEPEPPGPTTPIVTPPGLVLGTGSEFTFVAGELDTTIGGETLSYGGSMIVSVNVAYEDDFTLASDTEISVFFTSDCVASGEATIDTTAITSNGVASATYTSISCEGTDTITASLSTGSTATTSVDIASRTLGYLQFVAADPLTIALKGNGSTATPEVSKLTFAVLDDKGLPVDNVNVDYQLSTTAGGITLSADSSVTDVNGRSYVWLSAGTAAVNVTVTATVEVTDGSPLVTTSLPLYIGGAIPDQNSFSISATIFNPRGYNYNGSVSEIGIRAADLNNNPAPDGTQISFVTDGGSIERSCTLVKGACKVNWISQNPRPADGLVNILARTTGEESFTDNNSNGLFDIGETIETHLSEAYNDENNSGSYELGEFFSDIDNNGVFTVKQDELYQGSKCSAEAQGAGHCANLVDVRNSLTLCMSTDAVITTDSVGGSIDLRGLLNEVTINLSFTDANNLTPARGTQIEVSASDLKIISGENIVVPNQCRIGGVITSIRVQIDDDEDTEKGILKIKVTQVNGVVYTHTIDIIE